MWLDFQIRVKQTDIELNFYLIVRDRIRFFFLVGVPFASRPTKLNNWGCRTGNQHFVRFIRVWSFASARVRRNSFRPWQHWNSKTWESGAHHVKSLGKRHGLSTCSRPLLQCTKQNIIRYFSSASHSNILRFDVRVDISYAYENDKIEGSFALMQ